MGNDPVGESISLTVLSIREGQVKLGVAAPGQVPVHREEIYRRIHMEVSVDATAASLAPIPEATSQ